MKVATGFSTCEQCTNNCARCNPNNLNQCFSCFEGSFLDGNNCSSCPSSCAVCSSATVCFECATGFVQQQAASQQTSQLGVGSGLASAGGAPLTCVACSAPCATCFNSPTTCLSCNAGFLLSGNSCLDEFFVEVSVTFNPTNNNYDFFNDNYEVILTGMANAAGVSLSAIVVQSIIYNSVILNA